MIQASTDYNTPRGLPPGRDAEGVDKAYRFADLARYTFRKRLSLYAADLAFYGLIQLIGRTVRFTVEGWEHWEATSRDGCVPIYTFWHDCIFLATYFSRGRGIAVMTSQSFDGEYVARFIQRLGFGAVRGSSTRGGSRALLEMARLMRHGVPTAFAIDGPKGPRHVAKMGAVLLAKITGQPIVPGTITAAQSWELSRSWDRFQIPKPFTRARVEIAAPILVPTDADNTELAARRAELQAVLDRLDSRGQQWQATRPRAA
jgi:lysophospholipid acyltransferase (LPLAT)-like uncharacterized protein